MSSKTEKDKNKAIQEKLQSILCQLLREEDNKFCVDCDTKGPRWASWNLGIFLCIRCAGIHRNLGVHVSRVKSVNLDSWTAEQVAMMKEMGNSRARAVYEANLPDNYRRPLTDSGLEMFIRQKYEEKKYIAREWIPPKLDVKSLQIDDVDVTPRATSSNKARPRPVSTVETQSRPRLSSDTRQQSVSGSNVSHAQTEPQIQNHAPNHDLLALDVASTNAAAVKSNSEGDLLGISFATSLNISEPAASAQPMQTHQPAMTSNIPDVDLFGDGSASEQQRKMNKENILKLYSSTPAAAPMGQMPMMQPMYGMPAGPMGMQPVHNGGVMYGGQPAIMAGGGGWAAPGGAVAPQHNPMMMRPGMVPAANYNFVPGTFGQPYYQQTMPNQYGPNMAAAGGMPLARYPGVSQPAMTNGSMMSAAPPMSGHTLSTHLWQ